MLPWSGLAGLERTWYGSAQQLALYLPAHTHTSPPRPESVIGKLYANAYKALKPGGRLLVHDFMVNDSLDGPELGSLWALQHVTVNADGLGAALIFPHVYPHITHVHSALSLSRPGLCPAEVISRMGASGFDASKCQATDV